MTKKPKTLMEIFKPIYGDDNMTKTTHYRSHKIEQLDDESFAVYRLSGTMECPAMSLEDAKEEIDLLVAIIEA